MKLSVRQATILLAAVISARATSFMFSKLCLTTMNSCSLIALRFTVASLLLLALFSPKIIPHINRRNVLSGALIGALYFFVMICEYMGLKTTNASTTSFIENLAIIVVPLAECLLGRRLPTGRVLLSAVLAMLGVGMLTMTGSGFSLTAGEIWVLGACLLYAAAIMVTSRLAPKGNPFVIGFFQVTTTGLLAWLSLPLYGGLTLPTGGSQYAMVFMLAFVCTFFGFTLQPVAQSRLPAETAGAFCALGPLVASVLSFIFLKEAFPPCNMAGAALILISLSIESGLIKLPKGSRK